MGSIERRLAALEAQLLPEDESSWDVVSREFYRRLTWDELKWLLEPSEEAEQRVTCPLHGPRCICTNERRRQRGFEEYPELEEEFGRRWLFLYERRYEILEREPEDFATSWRRRHGIGT